jgi:hypothetical protein
VVVEVVEIITVITPIMEEDAQYHAVLEDKESPGRCGKPARTKEYKALKQIKVRYGTTNSCNSCFKWTASSCSHRTRRYTQRI